MAVTEPQAVMPQAVITDEMIAAMAARAGTVLRIDHSVNNELASRIAVAKFAGGVGDINPLWTDSDYARSSPYGAPVAPPSFVIGCFSGIQFGWPGLGSFHSQSHLTFERPVYWGTRSNASCVYEGFDGPAPSSFAGRTVTDRFRNTYTNQWGERIATVSWQVINFERGRAAARQGSHAAARQAGGTAGPVLPHPWTEDEVAEIEARVLAERPRGARPRNWEDVHAGEALDVLTKGPIGMTDEIAFVAGGGTPIPRLKAHAAALHDYHAHPAWAFRDPVTRAREPIYSVHYNLQAARAMSVAFQYDVGFPAAVLADPSADALGRGPRLDQGGAGPVPPVRLPLRRDRAARHGDRHPGRRGRRPRGRYQTEAVNQRGEVVMPGHAVIALPTRLATAGGRGADGSPAARRARSQP